MKPAERETVMLSRLQADLAELDPTVVANAIRQGKQGVPIAADFDLEKEDHFEIAEDDRRQVLAGFWAEGEPELGVDEDYFGDDLTSDGHGELQKQRDIREYARLIAWELPLLNQLARPFVPPTEATPFRFRYTSYLGESHPAANKVTVEFCPQDLTHAATPESHRLAAPHVTKLIKLAGPRYNPVTQTIKLSCEEFDTQAQNKRFLGETIRILLQEASAGDSFEDLPFDFRHVKQKKKVPFPQEWALTQERKHYLEASRAASAKIEDERRGNGKLVDGARVIEASLPLMTEPAAALAEHVTVGAQRKKI